MGEKKSRRIFTPEQKYEILQDISTFRTINEGVAKYQLHDSVYRKWKRQLAVGIRASLRNSKPPFAMVSNERVPTAGQRYVHW